MNDLAEQLKVCGPPGWALIQEIIAELERQQNLIANFESDLKEANDRYDNRDN
jgi:hypothetical protein